MNDEKTGSLVHTLFFQGCPGSFTCLSIEHWVQGTLELYVTCDRQAAEFLLMKDNIENLGLPTRGLNHRLQRSRLAFLPLDHSAANTRNTCCKIFKKDSCNIKLNIVSKPLRLVLAISSLLEEHNTRLLSLQSWSWGDSFSVWCRYLFEIIENSSKVLIA